MSAFELPSDIIFNTGRIADAAEFARAHPAASWLLLTGDEFAAMGGVSFAQVQPLVDHPANIVSDPPLTLNLELARQHVAALDRLPRPTLVTCRMGPRASAVTYMYAGLKAAADPDEVVACAEAAGAPFCQSDELKEWVGQTITALRQEHP
jgi:hypothetical protein